MQITNVIKETSNRIGRSATFKLVTICILVLVLLIPASMVKSLIRERESRNRGVINEINDKWGQAQTILGPVISIPYHSYIEDRNGKTATVTKYMHLLPDTLRIDSHITPDVRYRGIYKAVLYNTAIVMDGSFPLPPLSDLRIAPEDILWSGTLISVGITDMRGIVNRIAATFDGQALAMEPGVETADVIQSGVSAAIHMDNAKTAYSFHFELNLNGSRKIQFSPVGKVTTVTASSSWKDPSFYGAFLPTVRTVNAQGFSATWNVLHLNRNYPQYWKGKGNDLDQSTFGVQLFNAVDIYQKSMRTAKYALMFIVFAFLAFFLSEVMNKLRVHPVQYLLIGMAIIIFYTLLLSFSEHIEFGAAYLISAVAVIGLISGYAKAILKNKYVTAMVGGILTILYTYLYILLQLEDYALLMGSVGLFLVLAAVMYLTRKIDWYGIHQGALKPQQAPPIESGSL